jgi:hypothetical protein
MTTELEDRETIREIMAAWEKYRPLWMAKFGNDEGFADWFTKTIGEIQGSGPL